MYVLKHDYEFICFSYTDYKHLIFY